MTASLIERLEKAEAGSRELDYAIKAWLEGFDAYWAIRVAADWSTSLDAALALAERVLPGWLWCAGTNRANGKTFGEADAYEPVGDLSEPCEWFCQTTAATPALALCLAILKARQASPSPSEQTGEKS